MMKFSLPFNASLAFSYIRVFIGISQPSLGQEKDKNKKGKKKRKERRRRKK